MQTEPTQTDVCGLRQALARAMAQLKPRPAEIFALRFLEGLSNRQIAQMLGISQVLVAVIFHRTRPQLRKGLPPHLGDKSLAIINSTGYSLSFATEPSAST